MICITGGSGFIGSNLSNYFTEKQLDFFILDKRDSPLFPEKHITCDICDLDRLRETLDGEIIIHLAAEHRDDVRPVSRYYDVNVTGTENITRIAREKGIERIIFTSSVAVYGFAQPNTDESGAINPFNEYGKTKFQAEQILSAWQAEDPKRRSLAIVRPTVVFGPGNRGNIYNLLSFISSGKFIMIGNGKNQKSIAYVENVASFLCFATNFEPGIHIYNYVDKPDLDMNQLVTLIRRRLFDKNSVGLRLPFWLGMLAGYSADLIANATKKTLPISAIRIRKFCSTTNFASAAHSLKGFKAKTSLLEAIDSTLKYEFINPNPNAPVFYTE